MFFILGLLSVSGILGGWILFTEGLRIYKPRRAIIKRMQSIEGEVIDIYEKTMFNSFERNSSPSCFPVIKFNTPTGNPMTFRSEVGESCGTSGYKVGQRIMILFDPEGKEPPVINSWTGIWYKTFVMTIGGLVFIICGIGVGWLFYAIKMGILTPGV